MLFPSQAVLKRFFLVPEHSNKRGEWCDFQHFRVFSDNGQSGTKITLDKILLYFSVNIEQFYKLTRRVHIRIASNNNFTTKPTHFRIGLFNRDISSRTIDSNAMSGVFKHGRIPLILRIARSIFSSNSSLSYVISDSSFGKLERMNRNPVLKEYFRFLCENAVNHYIS